MTSNCRNVPLANLFDIAMLYVRSSIDIDRHTNESARKEPLNSAELRDVIYSSNPRAAIMETARFTVYLYQLIQHNIQ